LGADRFYIVEMQIKHSHRNLGGLHHLYGKRVLRNFRGTVYVGR